MRSKLIALLALVLAVATLAGLAAAPANAVTTTKTQITYIVSPHPDDVYQDWALVQNSPANYPVFIVLTNGESTSYCNGRTINVPGYGDYDTTTEDGCKRARKASLNSFLSNQTHVDSYLDTASGMTSYNITSAVGTDIDTGAPWSTSYTSCAPGPCGAATNPSAGEPVPFNANDGTTPTGWHLLVGPNSARAEFDLGDGNLTDAEVRWAITAVRAEVGIHLPALKEYEIIGAYSNASYSGANEYKHHDHRAVHEALYGGGYGIPALAATYLTDPDANAFNTYPYPGGNGTNSGRIISSTVYNTDMKANSSTPAKTCGAAGNLPCRDGGYFQQAFGWLTGDPAAVNGASQNWPTCSSVMGQTNVSYIFCQEFGAWLVN